MAPALQSSNTSVKISRPEQLWEVGHEKPSWKSGNSSSDGVAHSGNGRGGGRAASAAGLAAADGDSGAVSAAAAGRAATARAAAAGAAERSWRGTRQLHSRRRFDAAQRINRLGR